ncbi:SDR family oxidoreductase [Glycomyces harbinensis]|uniref:NAD(P)-dependent dehydrogenase, short-chain alcohol dehydrogenase family n=1 Tax=Glycomyces harbinensis TaxID=58114 RepID=A0A1G7BDU5_9ACTN|nr:SDR family oxidoreductase [Glycomyces harbinensis]SDE24556.1 NAD(P)-dependent dehydrogenase, short-chain alcohol dehydrogenase family [Glycomyces harbinensis]
MEPAVSNHPLKGRSAFVTGASRGIGAAIAVALGAAGVKVALFAKTGEPHPKLPGTLHETAKAIEEAGGEALPIVGDLRDAEAVGEAIEATAAAFGGLDFCVNNASALDISGIGELSLKKFDLIAGVNMRGTFASISAALPYLRESDHAHLLTISPPLNTNPDWFAGGPYTATKYGMTIMTLGAAQTEPGIGANCLWPKTTIATAAVEFALGGQPMLDRSRKPSIVADAALAVLARDPNAYTGNAVLVEDLLAEEGVTDLDGYAVVPGQTDFQPDIYVDLQAREVLAGEAVHRVLLLLRAVSDLLRNVVDHVCGRRGEDQRDDQRHDAPAGRARAPLAEFGTRAYDLLAARVRRGAHVPGVDPLAAVGEDPLLAWQRRDEQDHGERERHGDGEAGDDRRVRERQAPTLAVALLVLGGMEVVR